MKKNDYELSVKVDGSKLPEYGSHGKTYVRGEIGREFTLQFKNNTADRVLARFSVDGLSVLDGKSADKDSSGYICDAYSSIDIAGWRTSLEEVRKFEFSSKSKSYAGKTVSSSNCGVIGVQVYSEKQPKVKIVEKHIHHHHDHYPEPYPVYPKWPWRKPYDPWDDPWKPTPMWGTICKDTSSSTYSCNSLSSRSATKGRDSGNVRKMSAGRGCSCSSPDEVSEYNLGTKFGDSKADHVRTVKFETGSLITQLEIYYTDREGLENAGINLDKKTPAVSVHPQAFGGFCQPPDDED
jgi:hypothetical protein